MGTSLKILAAVSLAAALLFLGPAVVLADTDGFVVHCVLVTVLDPRFSSCDDQHPTIQAAVNHAEADETVLVGAGIFPEQVVISKPLTLEGAGVDVTTIKNDAAYARAVDAIAEVSPEARKAILARGQLGQETKCH